jgi:multiple sugar transport system ATP-binding protein
MTLASRIAVMHQGQLQQFDAPQKVYSRPANMFVAGFMGSPAMNFLSATLAERDGKAVVDLPGESGAMISLPLARRPPTVPADRQIVLGFRPEHLYRYDDDHKARRPFLARVSASVDLVEPTGAETIATLKVAGRDAIGRFEPDVAPAMGETFDLGIDMAHACLFDPTTQSLLSETAP